jgi:NET1-associated nuclear protein 1 (U3 small nucleolar RNA-associated protein 17)
MEPYKRATVPFQLQAIAWYPPSQNNEPASFSLLGITTNDRAVLFGDEAQTLADRGASSNGVVDSSDIQKTTLFRDIFGNAAFADMSSAATGPVPALASVALKRAPANIFDVPAYLLPSVDSLYDSLMGSFLHRQPAEDVTVVLPASHLTEEDSAWEKGLEVDQEVSLGRSFVDDDEIDAFVDLFRHVAVKCKQLPHLCGLTITYSSQPLMYTVPPPPYASHTLPSVLLRPRDSLNQSARTKINCRHGLRRRIVTPPRKARRR